MKEIEKNLLKLKELQEESKKLDDVIASLQKAERQRELPPEDSYFSYAWTSFDGMRQTIKDGEVIKVIGIPIEEAKEGYANQLEGK